MASPSRIKKSTNIFERMHPLQRIVLSAIMSLVAFFFVRKFNLNWVLMATVLWDVFAFLFILTSWIVFFTRPVDEIKKLANREDGSWAFVMFSILVSSFASMFTVMLLMISDDQPPERKILTLLLSVAGMMFSWIMVHTIFTFHYAHLYYDEDKHDTPKGESLTFPGQESPDYLDFAYFSFGMGMTFQVSDVQVCSPKIRRTALAHSLLAFALNTFVVALTINLIAGLKK